MTYLAKDQRRAAIVAAACSIIAREGLAAATVRAVAQSIDAAPGQIHHHFATVDDLRAEAFALLSTKGLRDYRDRSVPMTGLQRVYALLSGEGAEQGPSEALCRDAVDASRMSKPIREALRLALDSWQTEVSAALSLAQQQGDLAPSVKIGDLAGTLVALVTGMDLLRQMGQSQHNLRQAVARQIALAQAA